MVFTACLTVAAVLLHLFSTRWLAPSLALPVIYNVVMTAALSCVVVVAWISDRNKLWKKVHWVAAYVMAGLMPIMSVLILMSPQLSTVARVIAVVALVVQVILAVSSHWLEASRRNFLFVEVAYINTFFIVLLGAAYL